MAAALKVLGAVLGIAWPLIIFVSLHCGFWQQVLPFIAAVFVIRLFMISKSRSRLKRAAVLGCLIALLLLALSEIFKDHRVLFYYPVAVNLLFLTVFAGSLFTKESLIESLARLKEPNLDEAGVVYTRKVTIAWCIFFAANGSISLAAALYGDLQLWTLWSGGLSYLAVGMMFAAEWVIRKIVRAKQE